MNKIALSSPIYKNQYVLRPDAQLVVMAVRSRNAWNVRLHRADGRAMTIARLNGLDDLDTFFDPIPEEPKEDA